MTRSQSAPLLLIVALCWLPMSAQAACLVPPHEVLWSFPADGAEGVPTDTSSLWLLTSRQRFGIGEVLLDGVQLLPIQRGRYALPPLAPRTRYTVSVANVDVYPGAGGPPRTVTFTTGDGPQEGPTSLAFSVVDKQAFEDFTLPTCYEIVWSQTCLDSAPVVRVHFEVEGAPDAILWMIQGMRGSVWWPASCGNPNTWTYEDLLGTTDGCFLLTAVDRFNQSVTNGPFCIPTIKEDSPSDTHDQGDSASNRRSSSDDQGCNLIGTRRPLSDALACWYLVAAFGLAAYVSTRRRGAASSIPPSAD